VAGASRMELFLQLIDRLDLPEITAAFAPTGRVLTVDGRRAEGTVEIEKLLGEFVSALRSASHRIIAQWQQDDVWIAEIEADYELRDWLELKAVPRAMFLREGADGVTELHVYGAHEHPISEHRTGGEGMWIGERFVPPL
jgi:hypothetical protein